MTAEAAHQKSKYSLNLVVIAASLAAVVIGTGSWTLIEYLSEVPLSAADIVGHHLVPAAVTGLIIWITLSVLLHRSVIEPLKSLFAHLYRIGSGRLEPLESESRINEIQSMVDGVNLLARRLQFSSGDDTFSNAQERLKKIRKEIRSMADAAGDDSPIFLEIVKELSALEGDVLELGRASMKN